MHGGARRLDEELLEQLGIAFNKRLQVLMTTALNAGPRQDLSAVMAKLTLQEQQRALRQHDPTTPTRLSASVCLHPIRSPRPTPPCPRLTPPCPPAVLEAGREAKNSFEKWRSRQTKMESSALVGHKRHAPNSRRAAPRQKQHS